MTLVNSIIIILVQAESNTNMKDSKPSTVGPTEAPRREEL